MQNHSFQGLYILFAEKYKKPNVQFLAKIM